MCMTMIASATDTPWLQEHCRTLMSRDAELAAVVERFGQPRLWTRPNGFASLVQIILEQQVSLASARSAIDRLEAVTSGITPESVLHLDDQQMRDAYVSRQKAEYIRGAALATLRSELVFDELAAMDDDTARQLLCSLKGIGAWTADIYLIEALRRRDIYPVSDLAARNGLKEIKALPSASPEELEVIAVTWAPYRTAATMIIWHHYLWSRNRMTDITPSTVH